MSPAEPTIINTSDASAIEIEIARRNAVIIFLLRVKLLYRFCIGFV